MHALIQEKRPLKRSRLGPPDVYPQEAKQKEDELTPANVKHGYSSMSPLSDEFGTAHNSNVTSVKVASFLSSVISKKEELMTLQDSGRKKQQINCKDNFWPVSPRTKSALDAWFKDLAGNKPLISLAKKAPSFNKKEDIFITLCDNQVNMQRATWFIKLSAAYTLSFTESKNKKRSIYDPAADWTSNITKFMREVLYKMQEHQNPNDKSTSASGIGMVLTQGVNMAPHANNNLSVFPSMSSPSGLSPASAQQNAAMNNSSSSLSAIGSNFDDCRNAIKYWKYCAQLSKYMYEESLLDRQEFLNWILDLIDKIRSPVILDGATKKLVLSFALQYMQDFVQSERMCRKLAYTVAKKLSSLLSVGNDNLKQKHIKSQMHASNSNGHFETVGDENKQGWNELSENIMKEYNTCPHHHDIITYLSTILQIITIECPTALVWCGIGENRPSSLSGSPLDCLIIPPSALPMPPKCERTNSEIRKQLFAAETEIVQRSKHAENRWFSEKWLDAKKNAYAHILSVLDHLDTHCFDRIDQTNSIHSLYASIFPPVPCPTAENNAEVSGAEKTYDPKQDADTVKILCEWAVSNQRWGEHRAFVVSILLDKRQIDVTIPQDNGMCNNGNGLGQPCEDADSVASGAGLMGGLPIFQTILMDFLDNDAPVLDENSSAQNRAQFTNLVHLFSTLIRYDVFSHNAYLHTLISRGDLVTENNRFNHISSMTKSMAPNTATTAGTLGASTVTNKSSPSVHAFEDEFSANMDFKQSEFDDSNVDDDLDRLLQNIKEKGQQNALEAPDSPKIPDQTGNSENHTLVSRHFVYTKHFPIPQEDNSCLYSSESNQRYILLFGIGKERDEKKHAVKKMAKDICKLFSKKFSIDVAEGGKVKKHSRNEFNFEATINKCQAMAYFDQHVITYQCSATVLEQLNGFAQGSNNYLPVQEHVAFLFDLMEMALNIYSLLELCDSILKELPEVESQLQVRKSNLVRSYTTSLALYIVGILRRYHCCLLLSMEQTISIFEGLCRTIKHVVNPSECSSAERCILAYLSDLYDSCEVIGTTDTIQCFHQFALIKRFKELLVVPEQLSLTTQVYNPQFLQELFSSPRRGGKVDTLWIRQVQESPSNMYSLVSNAFIAVCRETDNDRLNDIAISCAELTANCNTLSEEWIAALQSICNAPKKARYPHLFGQIDIHNSKVHNSLAIFICILVARHCFSLADFVVNFALPTLANAYPVGGEITADAEAGARLTCHLVLKLFKTIEVPQPGLYFVGTSPNPINIVNGGGFNIKLSCDRHLLVGAHKNIPIEAVLAVLKGILIVVDKKKQPSSLNVGFGSGKRSGFNTPVHPGSTPKNNDRPADLSQILGTSDLSSLSIEHEMDFSQNCATSNSNSEQISLLDFAYHVLKQICAQEHVLERCLKNAEKLCDMIIDEMLTTKQVQRVLHMICYPESEYNIICEMDQRSMISRIFENLKQWTLRISWLDLQLMYRQSANNPTELNTWLDTVARAAIDVFQMEEASKTGDNTKNIYKAKPSTWLVTPLILKLTPAVQGRILRMAGQVLENITYFSKSFKTDNSCTGSGDERERSNSCSILTNCNIGKQNSLRTKRHPLNYKPFLGLVLACLRSQDDHKEGLLFSLYTQLTQFLQSFSDIDAYCGNDELQEREDILDALQVRFSLIGGMFDLIIRNGTSTMDWAILLAQLVCQGVIDHNSNKELLTTVVDMLTTLVHFTLTSDNHSDRDENKKLYINLMKKLKKEIGEKNSASIKIIRQLLPLYKQATEVISCEPAGVDTKGNKICDVEKKQLRISDKQRISVWDILEGHKNPAPLSWVWFGAVKLERKPLFYEESHKILKYHTHNLKKPTSFFFEALPIPPEDVEQSSTEKVLIREEMKADTPSSVDQSPSASVSGRSRNKGTTVRKRKTKTPKTPPVNPTLPTQMTQQQQQQPQQLQNQAMPTQQQVNQNQNVGQHVNSTQLNPMQINMQVNMAQFGGNPLMHQNPNQMIQQQLQPNPGNMQSINANMQPNSQIGYIPPGTASQGLSHNPPNSQQQQWPGQSQYHNIQPQQQQQSSYQQAVQMNRFERPLINQSKQALSNMLRQRQPPFNPSNPSTFNQMQQQRQANNMQPQQQQQVSINSVHQQQVQQQHLQQQQQQYARGTMRVMNSNQVGPSGPNLGTPVSLNQNQMLQSQSVNSQQNAQGLNINAVNSNNGAIINQQVSGALVNPGGIMQPNVGVNVSVNNNAAGNPNINPSLNQSAQFQGFNQFQQQSHSSNANPKQAGLGFNQMGGQRNAPDFMTQQQQRTNLMNNRGQFINSAPNVTMNNIIGQNSVQSYTRQPSTVGKPGLIPPQQQFQPHRIHHQMMQLQGSQMGIGQQNTGTSVIGQQQNQGVNQQQNPNLVAQLQIQMSGQSNLIGQQYPHQTPPY